MPRVCNLSWDNFPVDAVYIGRPSEWGNPFSIPKDGNRNTVIKKYREWIYSPAQKELFARVRSELKGKDLVCWCSPAPCHGDVLLEIANSAHPILDELTRMAQENGEYE